MGQGQQASRTAVRYSKRQVHDEAWIKKFLHRAEYGTFATVQDGQPFMMANLFVYDEDAHAIYFHTALTGRTRTNIEQNANTCLSVSQMGRLVPAPEALEFSVEYAGVTVFGKTTIVDDEERATRALQMLLDKYFPHLKPGRDYRPIIHEELVRTSVYCMKIEEWSGKENSKEGMGIPGTFYFKDMLKEIDNK